MERELQQLRFSATEESVAYLQGRDPTLTKEQAEERRRQIVDDLNAGRIRVESLVEREVAGMFLRLNETVGQLLAECDWTLVGFPVGSALVLPDTGYTRYDPQPSVPGSGSGFLGTQTVETVIPVSPKAALVITRGSGRVGTGEATQGYAEDLNLRAHAQSHACIYGDSQQVVVGAHRFARQRPAAHADRRRRARTLWIGERGEGDPTDGPVRFTGYSIDGVRSELFDVDPRARAPKRSLRPGDMWK